LVVEGRTSKEIARYLKISPLTVRKHRENVMRKLGVHSMAELVHAARSFGITATPSEVFRADNL
jgi:DNA-binding CsgD family transcriptional regulator